MKYLMCLGMLVPTFLFSYIRFNEPYEALHFIASYLPKSSIIVEAGAFNGNDTVTMAKMFPQATIHSFEPVPAIYNVLKETTRSCPQVHTYQYAVSDTEGIAPLYISKINGLFSQSSSLFIPKEHVTYYPEVIFSEAIMVPTCTFDQWAERNNIDHVDFMWLDMQGAELSALKASPRIMSTVRALLIELEFVEAYAGQPLGQEICKWLEEHGFEMIAINFDIPPRGIMYGDALFIRKQ